MRALCLASLFAASACTFSAETSDIDIEVVNISQDTTQNVDHLDVTLTRPDSSVAQYRPSFQPQADPSIALTFASGGQAGTYTLVVDEADRGQTCYSAVTLKFTLPAAATPLSLTADLSTGTAASCPGAVP